MEEKVLEPLKAYRGGEILDKWCKDNDILYHSFNDTRADRLYIVIDNEVCGILDPTSKLCKALIELKAVIVSDLPPRYRAPKGGIYWYITTCMDLDCKTDDRGLFDNTKYETRNYFKSLKDADDKLTKIKEILK